MDWFLYDRDLRDERVKAYRRLTIPQKQWIIIITLKHSIKWKFSLLKAIEWSVDNCDNSKLKVTLPTPIPDEERKLT